MKSLLVSEAASPAGVARIGAAIETSGRVLSVIHLRAQRVAFDIDVSLRELAQAVGAVDERIRDRSPEASVIYIEPDVCARSKGRNRRSRGGGDSDG